MSNTQEPRVPKSANGQGVKNSSTTNKICFRCEQPGHLKKDCPKQPYCSRCRTRGHIPVKCPLKKQGRQQSDKRHKSVNQGTDKRCKNCREDWKRAQDQPQCSHLDNRCLNCTGDYKTLDCPTRQQHQPPPVNNPVGSTGTNYQYPPQFQQPSPQQHSQQSQSIVGSSTPTQMVNNPQYQQGLQGQPQRQPVPPVQQVNQQVRPPTHLKLLINNTISIKCHKPAHFWHNLSKILKFHPIIQTNGNNRPHLFNLTLPTVIAILVKSCMATTSHICSI